ncbi:MAG: cobalamin-binding protein [Alphaproteobacteria bacterium]
MSAQPRIVSLIASATEIVCALGARDRLFGRSHECDYPQSVLQLPALTEPKLDVGRSSGEIDRQVKELLTEGLSVYRVGVEGLREIDPHVIVTQDQCEVCAASLADVEAAMCDWTGRDVEIVSLRPDSLADSWTDIRRVADAIGCSDTGAELVTHLQDRMQHIADITSDLRPRPRVACIEWIDPLMAAGNWMPELVEMAGGHNLFGEAGKHSPWMTWVELKAADPDVIIVLPCGFDMPRVLEEMPLLTQRDGWPGLKAVQNGQVYVTDGNQYFNRPGPRLAESLEILAEILHPDAFAFGYEGSGWQHFSSESKPVEA